MLLNCHCSHRFLLRFNLGVLIATFLSLSPFVHSQTTISTGSIQGTITDPSGALVAGANITITHKATGQVIETTTNSAGTYISGALGPGSYVVRIEVKGFKTTELALDIQVGVTASGSVKLEAGEASQVQSVPAAKIPVNSEGSAVQGVLTGDQLDSWPVNGRNFLELAQLEPGVQVQDGANFDPTKVGYTSISFGGRFGRSARTSVDGVDISDETVGTTTQSIPASGIEQFQVSQSSLDLTNELTSSGAVNVVTRTGTNQYHGEAFYLFRDSGAAASLPHPPDVPAPFQRNMEGGRVGGPVIKDKMFFFLDGEYTLQHLAAPVVVADQFAGFSGSFQAPYKEGNFLGRLDYQVKPNLRMFYRFSYFQNSSNATFAPSSFQVYENKDYSRQNVGGADFTTGSYTHSARFSYFKFQNQIADATRGSGLPFADLPVSINIGSLYTGPNALAPQSTPQSDLQLKYDGSKTLGRHVLRYGISYNHIQSGGYANFFATTPNMYSLPNPNLVTCTADPLTCPVGPDGTVQSNPLNYPISETIIGNGLGFSTEHTALGFPAGGLGPDNRLGLYIGDSWKIRPSLMITAGLRYVRDSGRTDSDLPAIPELNAAFPGYGNRVRQPNSNFAPQFGMAWDPKSNGKLVVRGGIGLYYENVIFNNVLFDRPQRLATGAFLQFPDACLGGAEQPVQVPVTPSNPSGVIQLAPGTCSQTIGQAAQATADFQAQYQAATPFDPTAANPNFVGTALSSGFDLPLGLFAPNYQTPRSVQMNVGTQWELRPGLVLSADYVRNVTTHTLLGVDINHVGDVDHFNVAGALAAIDVTNQAFGCPLGTAGINCAIAAGATMADYAGNGLTASSDLGGGGGCPAEGCAFPGIKPQYGAAPFLFPIGRSVYYGLQMKLVENMTNPVRGLKAVNFQVSYSLSRFTNAAAWQGNFPPSGPVGINDQDFVIQAGDNRNASRYMGPSLLDRTNQISFGGTFDVPKSFRIGILAHFYSPLSSPVIVGATGALGDIFRTDFTGDGTISDPVPGTTNGSFGRDFGVGGLNTAINNYNQNVAGRTTPAGNVLISNNLFTLQQLVLLGGVAPQLDSPPQNQVGFQWLKAFDFKLGWSHTFSEKVTIEPSLGFFNLFNFANFDLPPGTMTGWLNEGAGSINSTTKATDFRVGQGTGVFGLGAPRVLEFGLRVSF